MEIIEICGYMGAGKSTYARTLKAYYDSKEKQVIITSFSKAFKDLMLKHFGMTKEGIYPDKLPENNSVSNFLEELWDNFEFLKRIFPDVNFENEIKSKTSFINRNLEYLTKLINTVMETKNSVDYRILMQAIGTDIVRYQLGEEYWVYTMLAYLIQLDKDSIIIIDDMRFPNEDLRNTKYHAINRKNSFYILKKIRVEASVQVRAKRLRKTVDEVIQMQQHVSEENVEKFWVDEIVNTENNRPWVTKVEREK